MTEAPLRARGEVLGPAYDLIAAYGDPSSGFFMERGGFGLASAGAAARIVVPGGPEQIARAHVAVRQAFDEIDPGDQVPVATGAFGFDGSTDAVLVIPRRFAVRRADGVTRQVLVDPAFAEEDGQDGVWAARRRPHDAFEDIQLHAVPPPADYADAVARAVKRIRAGELRKVVLARSLEVDAGRDLDPRELLRRLRAVDPDCYAFSVPVEPRRVLVGASPELLVARSGLEVRSDPLAGSSPRFGDPDEDRASAQYLRSSSKNRDEHAVVAEAVSDALRPFCEELTFDREPVLLGTANVWHLQTRFLGRLREPAPGVLELLATLHPTPAVCGAPRDVAQQAISELEPFDRRCYAGPVGWVDKNGDGEWAIALRCAEIEGGTARLFAGAGIVADSSPDQEVDETERKFRALLDSLRWG
jgi:isochorismate synthase